MSDELTADERKALDELPREGSPPAGLEDRTVEALRRLGLLRRRPAARWPRWLAAAAAAVILFGGGLGAGRWTAAGAAAPRPEYLLLLQAGAGRPVQGTELRGRIEEYARWARDLARQGALVAGEKLGAGGLLLSGDGAVREHSFATAGDEHVQGYFLIRARSDDEAVDLARSCPHIKYGGRIEVRRIDHGTEES